MLKIKSNLTKALFIVFAVSSIYGCASIGGKPDPKIANPAGDLVLNYITAMKSINSAQLNLTKALGLEEEANKLEEQKKLLEENSVASIGANILNKITETSNNTDEKIKEALKTVNTLNLESLNYFVAGAKTYAEGAVATTKMVAASAKLLKATAEVKKDMKKMNKDIKSMGGEKVTPQATLADPRVVGAMLISPMIPSMAKDFVNNTNDLIAYGKKFGVDVAPVKAMISKAAGF